MPYAFVSQVEFSKNGSAQPTVSAPAFTPVAGNDLICAVWVDAGGVVDNNTTIDDSTGSNDTWTNISGANLNDGLGSWSFWYLKNAAAVSTTVRATFPGNMNFPAIYVAEFSGLDTTSPFLTSHGLSQFSPGTGTDALSSGATGTLGGQPALVFGFAYQTSGNVLPSAGTGYTSLTGVWNFEGSQATSVRPEHKRVTATTAVTATATQSVNGNAMTAVLVFLEATAPSNTLKTLAELADASIKTALGLAKASIKTLSGLIP